MLHVRVDLHHWLHVEDDDRRVLLWADEPRAKGVTPMADVQMTDTQEVAYHIRNRRGQTPRAAVGATWESSDPNVVTVQAWADGTSATVLAAGGEGAAQISVTFLNGVSLSAIVTVTPDMSAELVPDAPTEQPI